MKTTIALIGILAAAPVLGHEGMHGPAASFDKDGDGTLSLAEYTAYLQATKESTADADTRFKALDANDQPVVAKGTVTVIRRSWEEKGRKYREEKILDSLVYLREEVEIDPAIAAKARRAVERMIHLKS